MKLTIPIHSSNRFTWSATEIGYVGGADRSDFNEAILEALIYDDACDQGFSVESEKTGRILTFTHFKTIRYIEGDIQFDTYLCVERNDISINIYNE